MTDLGTFNKMSREDKDATLAQMRDEAIAKWRTETGISEFQATVAVDLGREISRSLSIASTIDLISVEEAHHIIQMLTGIFPDAVAKIQNGEIEVPEIKGLQSDAELPATAVSASWSAAVSHQVDDHELATDVARLLTQMVSIATSAYLSGITPPEGVAKH